MDGRDNLRVVTKPFTDKYGVVKSVLRSSQDTDKRDKDLEAFSSNKKYASEVIERLKHFEDAYPLLPQERQGKLRRLTDFYGGGNGMEIVVDNFIHTAYSHPHKFDRAWEGMCQAAEKYDKARGNENLKEVRAIIRYAEDLSDDLHPDPTQRREATKLALKNTFGRCQTEHGPEKMKEKEALKILSHIEELASEDRGEWPATKKWTVQFASEITVREYEDLDPRYHRKDSRKFSCDCDERIFEKSDAPLAVSEDFYFVESVDFPEEKKKDSPDDDSDKENGSSTEYHFHKADGSKKSDVPDKADNPPVKLKRESPIQFKKIDSALGSFKAQHSTIVIKKFVLADNAPIDEDNNNDDESKDSEEDFPPDEEDNNEGATNEPFFQGRNILKLCTKCHQLKPRVEFTTAMWSGGNNCVACYEERAVGRTMEADAKKMATPLEVRIPEALSEEIAKAWEQEPDRWILGVQKTHFKRKLSRGMWGPGALQQVRVLPCLDLSALTTKETIQAKLEEQKSDKVFEIRHADKQGLLLTETSFITYKALKAYLTPYAHDLVLQCLAGDYLAQANNNEGWMQVGQINFCRAWLKDKFFSRAWPRKNDEDGIELSVKNHPEGGVVVVEQAYFTKIKEDRDLELTPLQIFPDDINLTLESMRAAMDAEPYKIPPGASIDEGNLTRAVPEKKVVFHVEAREYLCYGYAFLASIYIWMPELEFALSIAKPKIDALKKDKWYVANVLSVIKRETKLEIRGVKGLRTDDLLGNCQGCNMARESCTCGPMVLTYENHSFAIFQDIIVDSNYKYCFALTKENLDELDLVPKPSSAYSIYDKDGRTKAWLENLKLVNFDHGRPMELVSDLKVDELGQKRVEDDDGEKDPNGDGVSTYGFIFEQGDIVRR